MRPKTGKDGAKLSVTGRPVRGKTNSGTETTPFQPVLSALPVGLIVTNRQGRIVYANARAAELLGRKPDEVLNAPLEETLTRLSSGAQDSASLRVALNHLKLAIEEDSKIQPGVGPVSHEVVEFSLKDSANGDERFVRFNFFMVGGEAAPFSGYGVLLQDVTQDYTANQLKNEFVSMVSHELRTPLSAVQGFSELLLTKNPSPERQRRWLEMINRESVRLNSLIDDMLNLSQIEAGWINLRTERVELEPVIQQCVELLRVGSSHHSFKIEIEDNLPAAKADRDRLIQILNNIIGNAIKYSGQGGEIVIRAEHSKQEPDYIQISVSDQGAGIPRSELPHVFEKFYRASGAQSQGVKGTGLGLAITRNLVELQQGRIWVESEEGQGSTFFFTLPGDTLQVKELKAFEEILLKTLLVSNKDTAEAELYLDYLQRTLPPAQLDEVLRDVLYEVGEKWARGEIGVGDEHLASNVVREFLSRRRSGPATSSGYRLVIGNVAGEEHVVGANMVANAFMRAGWAVTNLGANVPLAAFIATIEQVKPDLLLLSAATRERLPEIRQVVQEVRKTFPQLRVGVGGRLLIEIPDLSEQLGVDFQGTTPVETVRRAGQTVRGR